MLRRAYGLPVVIIGTMIGLVATTGVAFAFRAATVSGSKSAGASSATAQLLTTTAVAASTTSKLFPSSDASGNASLVVKVTNSNTTTTVKVSTIAAGTGSVTGCTTPAVSVVTPTSGLPFTILPGQTVTVTLVGAVHMGITASNDCQTKTLTVPVLLNG